MADFQRLMTKIDQAKDLDFGDTITESIELFKQVWLKGFLVVLLIMIATVVLGFIFGLLGVNSSFDNIFNFNELNNESFTELFYFSYTKSILYNLPQTILISTLSLAMVAAFYRICNAVIAKRTEDDNYFYFFSKAYFSKVFMLGIIYTGIVTLAQLLFFIPYIYAIVPLSFFAVILANNPDLSEMEIVKASFALGNKKWLIAFGTMFVAGLIAMLGVIACFVGLLFTVSLAYLPLYLIYKNAIGIYDNDEIDSIGSTTNN